MGMQATASRPRPLVHLELHTGDRAGASAFFARLLEWKPEAIDTVAGPYLALDLGDAVSGGIVGVSGAAAALASIWPSSLISSLLETTSRSATWPNRHIWCIGTTPKRASSRSEGARAPSLSQRGSCDSARG